MSIIYVVLDTSYDGSTMLKAFTNKDKANAFKVKCDEHNKIKPVFPTNNVFIDEEEKITTKEYNEWKILDDGWRKENPAGDHYYFDDVIVLELELVEE